MTFLNEPVGTMRSVLDRMDGAWVISGLLLLVVLIVVPSDFLDVVTSAIGSISHTAIYILFAVCAVAYLKASDAESLIAKAFQGSEVRMIFMAALLGGLSPFCSCEIIPFIAAMLALGAPLSAVMALWLASPLMDPAMFSITASALGFEFAIAKTIAAISLGLFGGITVLALTPIGFFDNPLRKKEAPKSCCGSKPAYSEKPVWRFWTVQERRETFKKEATTNGLFLLKWLTLAYIIEAIMVSYVPASFIAGYLGGSGIQPVFLGALIGGPAYLNGYAAVPLVAGLLEHGMAPGAAMSFMLAGGVSCIPAAIAVWAIVKPKVFASYIGIGFVGSLSAGLAWAAWV